MYYIDCMIFRTHNYETIHIIHLDMDNLLSFVTSILCSVRCSITMESIVATPKHRSFRFLLSKWKVFIYIFDLMIG